MTAEDSLTDEEMADLIKSRDDSTTAMHRANSSFERLYERHGRLLLAFLSSRVNRSDLEDVHQSVWQKIWQYIPTQFRGGSFRAWMYQIARNHLIDLRRKKQPDELSESVDPADHSSSPDEPLADQERQEILSRCLGRLKEEMADIVRSRLSGEDYSEICTRLQIKTSRAHKLFFQAREQLTGCVQKAMQ